MGPIKRLYVVTGKGGVGKTLISLALAKHLKDKGHKVLHNSFDQGTNDRLCRDLDISTWNSSLEESATIYIARKLGSETVARWIMKTPFFVSLFNMIPGLGYMIYLGHIIDLLRNDPNLTIVLDSPSSGHLLTTFEVPSNFRDIFGSGILVQDINKMEESLNSSNFLKTLIVCLPHQLSLSEGKEVQEKLLNNNIKRTELLINDSLSLIPDLPKKDLPPFLLEKINNETQLLENFQNIDKMVKIPHFSSLDEKKIIMNLQDYIKGLV